MGSQGLKLMRLWGCGSNHIIRIPEKPKSRIATPLTVDTFQKTYAYEHLISHTSMKTLHAKEWGLRSVFEF